MKKFSLIVENLVNEFTIEEKYKVVLEDLLTKIEETLENSSVNLVKELMRTYISDADTTIVGLINDTDIFDFYILHRNILDELLSEIEYFADSPESLGVLPSVYDYVVFSSKKSIQLLFGKIVD